MNRSWMYGDLRERDFQEGLREFCIAAVQHQRLSQEPMIFFPCRDCGNVKRWTDINEILDHLYRRGFKVDYEIWYWHGEKLDINDEGAKANTFKCEGDEGIVEDRMDECKRDFFGAIAYLKHAFTSELQKKESHCKFILAH
ncbi:unnamed protein product [Amaranthus hypochondriacus]